MESLLLEIEQKRDYLLNTVKMYGLRSKEAITLSQELDELLNTYNTSLNKTSDFTHIQKSTNKLNTSWSVNTPSF